MYYENYMQSNHSPMYWANGKVLAPILKASGYNFQKNLKVFSHERRKGQRGAPFFEKQLKVEAGCLNSL